MPICQNEFSLDDKNEFFLFTMEPRNFFVSLNEPKTSYDIQLLNYCPISRLLSGSPLPTGTLIHGKTLNIFAEHFDKTKEFLEYFLKCACGVLSYAYLDFNGEFQVTFYMIQQL